MICNAANITFFFTNTNYETVISGLHSPDIKQKMEKLFFLSPEPINKIYHRNFLKHRWKSL